MKGAYFFQNDIWVEYHSFKCGPMNRYVASIVDRCFTEGMRKLYVTDLRCFHNYCSMLMIES